ncbi:MAG: translation initiation factor IF-3, partial [Caulobacteraceae bacterium]
RGGEMRHPELGMKLLNQVRSDFDPVAKVEYEPRMEGRQMIMILAPR